jgi:L-iditol 2-dehydrogenase
MKALVLTGKEQAEYRDVEKPVCPEDGMILKVEAVGLCGSDVRTYLHGHSKVKYPAVIGHENAGTIAEIGAKVRTDWKVGDRVIVNPAIPCGKCYYCTHGDMSGLCEVLSVYGNDIPGGFAQYMQIPGRNRKGQILRIPDGIDFDDIIIVELLASVIKAQEQITGEPRRNRRLIGTAPSMLTCPDRETAGSVEYHMSGRNPERLKLAGRFGATHLVNSSVRTW